MVTVKALGGQKTGPDFQTLGVGDEFYVDFVCFGGVEVVNARVVDGVSMSAVNEFKAKFVGVRVCGCKLHGQKVECQLVHKEQWCT